ncbi:hypothetical protein A2V71_01920 [Candidatus Berkelbacteria bacterium RBG_13_40_8]|uniref:Uncharacterized protein n=1 Tax=Candidatus Berkelbacteria bacterium RBG_13_40_8 TaxID=1797467 RepID=A0A1F5DPV8_9BACT|nr:MAG: hypothetical protein A2V71_01920 [Candidatus Berkelbacteria bacterium RBG_13_40_8]
MNQQDKKDIRQIFNEGFKQLVLPHFDNIYKNFDNIKKNFDDIKKDIEDIHNDIGSINRKLDVEISWRDDASKRLKKIEIKTGIVS